jgi:NitT/TauT family transport system permease protein
VSGASTTPGAAVAGRTAAPAAVRMVRRVLFLAVLIAVWADVAAAGWWPDYVLPGPASVASALYWGLVDGVYLEAIATSLRRLAVGYAIAAAFGLGLGVAVTVDDTIEDTLGTLVVGFQALPSVCWLPLAILWFGLNDSAVIFVVVMGSLFAILIGVERGIRTTSPIFVKAARNLGAEGLRLYWQVVVPAALPSILAGLKQGWAFAWRSLLAAELLFYSLSLGNLLQTGRDLNDPAAVMAVMVLVIGIGTAFDRWLFAPVERRVAARWGYGVRG